jgi:predicted enzyme related to lactoylglutathione lyase
MTSWVKTVVYPVKDADAAKKLYGALFGAPVVDQPYYVGYQVDGQDVGLDPNGHARGMTGPVAFWRVDDIAGAVEQLVAAGATVGEAAHDVGGGRLIAMLTDADGNPIGVLQDS